MGFILCISLEHISCSSLFGVKTLCKSSDLYPFVRIMDSVRSLNLEHVAGVCLLESHLMKRFD